MLNSKLKNLFLFTTFFLLQPMLTPGSAAWAKRKTPPKAYSFIAEGGKASQAECDGERKLPRLKKLKELAKAPTYMGSELQTPELQGKADGEMWKHFFKVKMSCNAVLAKTPSSVEETTQEKTKAALPEESDEDDEPTRPETP